MVLEVAEILVRLGQEDQFAAAYQTALAHLLSSRGCRSAKLTQGIENPNRFVLFVEWDTLEDHTEGFRGSEAFTRWRECIGPFFAEEPRVEHFTHLHN